MTGGKDHETDLEAGIVFNPGSSSYSPFDILSTKNASLRSLERWRHLCLMLHGDFDTVDLKREDEKKELLATIRAHVEVIRAANRFKEVWKADTVKPHSTTDGAFGIGQEELVSISRDHDFSGLQRIGGVKALSDLLKTNPEKGITGDEAEFLTRRDVFGFLWEAWQDLTLIILMIAAAASLALGIKSEGIEEGWYDGGSIAFAVVIVIVVTAISDYKQSLQFRNLNEEKRNIHLEVVRGGKRVDISIFDIVVGDVVLLKIGDQVPADGVLVSGHSLAVDESSMTGESKIVHKNQKSPFLMSGCKIAVGYGFMLVTGVGMNTEWGMLMASISEDNGEETPLQLRLNGVATFIGIVGLVVAFAVLVVLLIRYFTGHSENPDGSKQFISGRTSANDAVDDTIKIITIAVTIVVVAVPEGLPLAVTLTLAYSMRKMMRDKALVRRLSSCETMGSATTICSDKTGTLTMNKMTVVEAYACGRKLDQPNSPSVLPEMLSKLLREGIARNTTGSVYSSEGNESMEVSGSPTEKAILYWGVKLGMNFDEIRSSASVVRAFPFNSEKKRGGVAVKISDSNVHVHWKGDAEIIIANCSGYIDENSNVVDMKDSNKVIMIEFLGKFTSTVRLNWKYWLISVAIGFISWPLAVIGKLIAVPKTPIADLIMMRTHTDQHRCEK